MEGFSSSSVAIDLSAQRFPDRTRDDPGVTNRVTVHVVSVSHVSTTHLLTTYLRCRSV